MNHKLSIFRTLLLICTRNLLFMYAGGALDFRIHFALKNHCYPISAQSYDFCPHLRQLDILDFTLSHIQYILY